MTEVESYFRSYFADEIDLTAFLLTYRLETHVEHRVHYTLRIVDHQDQPYAGEDLPYLIQWKRGLRGANECTLMFSNAGKQVRVNMNHLPTVPIRLIASP